MYINKAFDIMYATKDCMYMMYQILKSSYFTEHMDNLYQNKKAIFNLFRKKYKPHNPKFVEY